jgi:hypothetical protein
VDANAWLLVQIAIPALWIALLVYSRRSRKDVPPPGPAPAAMSDNSTSDSGDLYTALQGVEPHLYQIAHPENLLGIPEFEAVVEMLCRADDKLQTVRRYREQPSPLVRDSARGWRSGRLDRVLDGDFDLIT